MAEPQQPFSPQEALEFMQRMWNPFGFAMPGFAQPANPAGVAAGPTASMPFPNPMAMFATLDPAEIEKKIAELKVIENWLSMSQNFLQMSIKTLELQKASLEAMRGSPSPGAPEHAKKKTK